MKKEFKGKVHGLRILRTSAFGIRLWEVRFASGKAYYEHSMKSQFPFRLDDRIRFEGEWMQAINGKYFQITNIIDVNDALLWNKEYTEKMSHFILNES